MNIYVKPPEIFSFSFAGRYGRLNYINASLIFGIVAGGLSFLIRYFVFPTGTPWFVILLVLLGLPLIILELRISVLRLHDLGLSGFWLLLFLVPVANVIMSILLLVLPGNRGANRYGPQSVQGSMAGLALLIILCFMVFFLTVSVIPIPVF